MARAAQRDTVVDPSRLSMSIRPEGASDNTILRQRRALKIHVWYDLAANIRAADGGMRAAASDAALMAAFHSGDSPNRWHARLSRCECPHSSGNNDLSLLATTVLKAAWFSISPGNSSPRVAPFRSKSGLEWTLIPYCDRC